jgi:hypothetical protein
VFCSVKNRKDWVAVMIRREEWDAAYRGQLADGQKRVGPPPTFEQVEALSRGELPEEEAEHVRELLSYYPDMLRVLTQPFPAAGEGILTDQELAADLAKIREHVRGTSGLPPIVFPHKKSLRRFLPIAAGVVIAMVLGSLAVWRMTSQPRVLLTQVLYPEGNRGVGARGVPSATPAHLSKGADYILKPVFDSRRSYREYRLELLDLSSAPPRVVWLRNNVAQQQDGTYPIRLSTSDLKPGLYRLVLYGVDEGVENLAEYTIRVKAE